MSDTTRSLERALVLRKIEELEAFENAATSEERLSLFHSSSVFPSVFSAKQRPELEEVFSPLKESNAADFQSSVDYFYSRNGRIYIGIASVLLPAILTFPPIIRRTMITPIFKTGKYLSHDKIPASLMRREMFMRAAILLPAGICVDVMYESLGRGKDDSFFRSLNDREAFDQVLVDRGRQFVQKTWPNVTKALADEGRWQSKDDARDPGRFMSTASATNKQPSNAPRSRWDELRQASQGTGKSSWDTIREKSARKASSPTSENVDTTRTNARSTEQVEFDALMEKERQMK